jgi:hypothetical protein
MVFINGAMSGGNYMRNVLCFVLCLAINKVLVRMPFSIFSTSLKATLTITLKQKQSYAGIQMN